MRLTSAVTLRSACMPSLSMSGALVISTPISRRRKRQCWPSMWTTSPGAIGTLRGPNSITSLPVLSIAATTPISARLVEQTRTSKRRSAIIREEESSSLDNCWRFVTNSETPEGRSDGVPGCARTPRTNTDVETNPTAAKRRSLAVQRDEFARRISREFSGKRTVGNV